MALTKNFLKNLGIDDMAVVDAIMNENGKSLDYWKDEVEKLKEQTAKLTAAVEENEKLKSEVKKAEGLNKKYDDLKSEFDQYKSDITAKEEKANKAAAVKEYFSNKHIVGNNLEIALMASQGIADGLTLEDGKIKDTKALDDLVNGKLSSLVSKETTVGAKVANPPDGKGAGQEKPISRAAQLAAQYHNSMYGATKKEG